MFELNDLYSNDLWSPDDQGQLGPAAPPSQPPFRQPPPRRITADELAALLDKSGAEPTRPAPLTSVSQLQGDDLRQARLGSLWAGLSALGTGISGHWDRAGAEGLPAIQAAGDRVLAGANARQQASYESSLADFKSAQEDQQRKAVAGGLMGYLNGIYDAEPAGSPFAARAEAAAKMGDMSALEKMAQQEPQRSFVRQHGQDPDAPNAWEESQRLQAQLKGQLEAMTMKETNPLKLQQATDEAKAVQDAKLPGEMKLKLAPSYQAPPQYEPLSRVAARTELVQGIEDKHAALRAAAKEGTSIPGRLGQAPDGTWGWLTPPTKDNPAPGFVPVDGMPKKAGGLLHFQKEGQPYVWNPSKPELGAIAVPTHDVGEAGAPSFQDLAAPPPRPAPNLGMGGQGPQARPVPVAGGPPAAAPVQAPSPSAKLNALMADPVMAAKIRQARASKISDAAIAAHLGL